MVFLQVEGYRNILKLNWKTAAFTSYKAFFENKSSGTNLPNLFSGKFLEKNICLVILHYQTKFRGLVAFTSCDIGQYVYCNFLLIRLLTHKFHVIRQPYLSNQTIISTWPKSQDEKLNMERAFKMKQNEFFIIFKGLSLKQIIFF